MVETGTRIQSLDGLRAVSILLVVVSHLAYNPGITLPPGFDPRWLESLGALGVRIFFVISGYLITRLLLREMETTGVIHLPRFYFRRTLRIFPPYFFFLAVVVIAQALGWLELSPRDLTHAVTYTVNYYPERSWHVGHAWSLSVEEQFYLLWPAILIIAGPRRGLLIALAFVLAAPFIRLGYAVWVPSFVRYELGYRFETAGDAIAMGCLLAGVQPWLVRQPLFRRVLASRLFAIAPLVVLFASEMEPTLKRYLALGIPIQNLGIAACVAYGVFSGRGIIVSMLNSRPMMALGHMSYSVYLWQQLFVNPFSSSAVCRFPLNLALIAATSLISYVLIERPTLDVRRRLAGRIWRIGRESAAMHRA